MKNEDNLIGQLIRDCIASNFSFIEDNYLLKIGCTFIKPKAPNVNLYCNFRPYRYICAKENNFNFRPTIGRGDFVADINLQITQFFWVSFMKKAREYLYNKMYFDQDGLDDKYSDILRDEIKELIDLWKYKFDEISENWSHGFHDSHISLNEKELPFMYPINSFIIQHEIGHVLYNIFVKNIYGYGDREVLGLDKVEDFAKTELKSIENIKGLDLDNKEIWVEELVVDIIGQSVCCKLNYHHSLMPSCFFALYGIAFSFLILLINTKYFNSIGVKTPNTHPDCYIRLTSLENYADAVNTGKDQEGYLLHKKCLRKAKEAIQFIERLLVEV